MKKTRFKLTTLALIIFSFFSSKNTFADFFYYPTAGGDGGNYFSALCYSGFMNGIQIRHGQYIDALGMQCENGMGPMTLYGGNGGVYSRYTCPYNYVMKGFNGRSGSLVDNLRPICALKSNKSITYSSTPIYGSTGGSFFAIWCGTETAMAGIHGRSDELLDQIGPVCSNSR